MKRLGMGMGMGTVVGTLAWVAACGNSTTTPATQHIYVAVSGNVQEMTLPPSAASTDFSQLEIGVANPGTLLVNPDAPALAQAPLDTTATGCTVDGCPWSLPQVDINGSGLGLVGIVSDLRPAGQQLYARAYTGIASPATMTTAKTGKSDIATTAPTFAVPISTLNTIVQLVADPNVADANTLIARGVMIGLVVGKPSEATPATNNQPPFIAGATVTPDSLAAGNLSMYFPNDDYTALNSNNVTNAHGMFIGVGKGTAVLPFQLTLTIAASDGVHTWAPAPSGMGPNSVLAFGYPADP
jgi:hypothetical protein